MYYDDEDDDDFEFELSTQLNTLEGIISNKSVEKINIRTRILYYERWLKEL